MMVMMDNISIMLVSLVLQTVSQSFFIQVLFGVFLRHAAKKASEMGIQLMNFSGRNTFFISASKIISSHIVKRY